MTIALKELSQAGHTQALLSVVSQNKTARDFYETLGGICVADYLDPGPLWKSEGKLYAWDLDGT